MAPVSAVFLIGGGRHDAQVRASHMPFVAACGGGPIVAFALEDPRRWEDALRLAGATDVRCVLEPPSGADLDGAAGVYVGGGWTPGYEEALRGWRPAPGLPYAGFSAGAAVAAARAIVGGYRLDGVEVCAEEAGEDLEALEVRDGLGLVPFAVDVHATQWGTLSRLVHAVAADLVSEGWAIDEGTVLAIEGGGSRVHGLGSAYRVTPLDDGVAVSVHR
jgi:cyanophycinase